MGELWSGRPAPRPYWAPGQIGPAVPEAGASELRGCRSAWEERPAGGNGQRGRGLREDPGGGRCWRATQASRPEQGLQAGSTDALRPRPRKAAKKRRQKLSPRRTGRHGAPGLHVETAQGGLSLRVETRARRGSGVNPTSPWTSDWPWSPQTEARPGAQGGLTVTGHCGVIFSLRIRA